MGEHKYNQTAVDAKNGLLPPKNKPKLSKRQTEKFLLILSMMMNTMKTKFELSALVILISRLDRLDYKN